MRLFRLMKSRFVGGHGLRLGARWAFCPVCEGHRPLVRLGEDEILVRCLACRASAIAMSMAAVLRQTEVALSAARVLELSCRGAFHGYLARRAARLTCSEYHADARPGEVRDGVLCQDVQCLTFPDAAFDLCTSTEVFEHVPDDRRGFAEIHRVLKPAGVLVFTVPLTGAAQTVERACLAPDGRVTHLLSPEYHLDPAKRDSAVLAFRNYGEDLLQRLVEVGFGSAEFIRPVQAVPWGYARSVVVARKGDPVPPPAAP